MRRGRRLRLVPGLLAVLSVLAMSSLAVSQSEAPARAALRLIVVSSASEAQEIVRRLTGGEDFATLATEYSIDPSATGGGYLGRVEPSALSPEIRDALKGVGPGQVTEVRTPAGYAILMVLGETETVEVESAGRARRLALAAPGNVRYVASVDGLQEIDDIFRRLEKPAGWEQDLRAICEIGRQAIRTGVRQFESNLASASLEGPSEQNSERLATAHHSLAQLWSYQGNMDNALEHWQAAYSIAVAHGPSDVQLGLEERLGIAYLHRSGLENSAHDGPVRSCIFPMRPGSEYKRTGDSERAIAQFLKCLARDPTDLEVRWLLNVAYMTLGTYPDAVPKEYLISPAVFESKEDIGRFADVAPSAGLTTFDRAGGAIVDDFDGDGRLDVVTSARDPCTPMHLFHNNGDGTFTDRASEAAITEQLGGVNMIHADYDNNGCLDILVLRGGWGLPVRNSLLRNNCDGTFTDVTHESGLAVPATATQTAAWADIDNDGHLDLFVGNEHAPSQLFLNKGDGTFAEIGHLAGVDRATYAKAVAVGDYDNDRYPDLFVSNFRGENLLYRNNRDRTFTDVARRLRVELPLTSFPAWFFDYQNDGWLDLFVTSYYHSNVEVARSYLQLPVQAETLKLYKNTGKGSFQDVTEEVGLNRVVMPMGANFGDVDSDGFLDFYLGTGNPSFASLVPNVLFRNKGGDSFVDITASSGTGCLHKGHGIAFADIDHDGDQDIFIEVGGAVPGDNHTNVLFKNPGNGNSWLSIRLVGVTTNRSAVGARIKLTLESGDRERRFIHRVVSSGGSFGASPLQQHIGLGRASRIETLEIWWPTSDTRQRFKNVPMNEFIEIREFEKTFAKVSRPPFQLGGGR